MPTGYNNTGHMINLYFFATLPITSAAVQMYTIWYDTLNLGLLFWFKCAPSNNE